MGTFLGLLLNLDIKNFKISLPWTIKVQLKSDLVAQNVLLDVLYNTLTYRSPYFQENLTSGVVLEIILGITLMAMLATANTFQNYKFSNNASLMKMHQNIRAL